MNTPPTPQLSIIAIFHDMRREAAHTLYSLSAAYQRGVSPSEYEVLAIDNGSAAPLDPGLVRSFGEHFHYHYYPTSSPSPVAAVHHGAGLARGDLLSVMVDGAHLLSPGVVGSALWLGRRLSRPFIAVPAFHL